MNSTVSHAAPDAAVAMIGAGNMARALIGGLLHKGHPTERLIAADPDPDTRTAIERDFGITTTSDNTDAVAGADVVVLAVKPQVIDGVLESVAAALARDAVVVSVAAGIPVARIRRTLGEAAAIIRVMPNTPALRGVGATGMYAAPECNAAQRDRARALFEAVGRVFDVPDESLMDVVTAVSGSGPAYFFALTEALARAGRAAGLPDDIARGLATQTAAGAGAMLSDGDIDPSELRRRVTSPGGTTAAALDSFARDGLEAMVDRAVQAAVRRGRELGDQ